MAQAGYTPIQLYFSTTAAAVPLAANLAQGELAINITDGKLYYEDNTGTVKVIAGAGGAGIAGGSNTQVQYNSSGSLAGSANFTFNGTTVTIANDASISGVTVGRGTSAVSTNTAVGALAVGAGGAGVTGTNNTGMGYSALTALTSGSSNTAYGQGSLAKLTTGSFNTSFGNDALGKDTNTNTASNNTAFGYRAGYSATTGGFNTAIGGPSSGGRSALYSNTTGVTNTAVGAGALGFSVSAYGNTAVGYEAGTSNSSGVYINAFGNGALSGNSSGNDLVAVGTSALLANLSGSNNVAVGNESLRTNSTTSNNTAVGHQAGYLSTGANNTYVGYSSGSAVSTGAKNVIIGSYTGSAAPISATGSNHIVFSDGDGNVRGYFDSTGGLNLPNGTANGVTYLNGSKVLTSGSALTFDGTKLVATLTTDATTTYPAYFDNSGNGSGTGSRIGFRNAGASYGEIGYLFDGSFATIINSATSAQTRFLIGGTEALRLTSTSLYTASGINVGIGTSSPTGYLANKLVVATGTDSNNGITIASASNRNGSIWFADGTTGNESYRGGIDYSHVTDSLYLYSGASGWFQLTSAGNVALGGVTPSAWGAGLKAIQIGPQSSLNSGDTAFTAATRLSTNAYSEASAVFKRIDSGFATSYYQQAGVHYWETAGSSTAGSTISFSTAMTLDASGGLKTLNTIGVGNATPSTSGAGITFPATQSASSDANTLDDYEEGTWTASFVPNTSGSITMNAATGTYTKVGRNVTINGLFSVTSVSSPTGYLKIAGLPFAGGGAGQFRCAISIDGTNMNATMTTVLTATIQGDSNIYVLKPDGAGGQSLTTAADIKASTQIFVGGTYLID